MAADSLERRSSQTVQYYLLEALAEMLAPVAPHLSEEIYQQPPCTALGKSQCLIQF